MKRVTLTFIVEDEYADAMQNEFAWGDMGNVASYLNERCEQSDYNIEDVEDWV